MKSILVTYKKFFSLLFAFTFCALKANALDFKKEPIWSLIPNFGVTYFYYPKNDFFVEKSKNGGNIAYGMFFAGSAFLEKRVHKRLGFALDIGYKNRNFAHLFLPSEYVYSTNLHCVDSSLLLSFLPKGYGGCTIYAGLKWTYIFKHKDFSHQDTRTIKIFDTDKDTKKVNFGGVIGARYEVDRTGIVIGGDYDIFMHNIIRSSYKKIYKLRPMGVKIYVGYDIARRFCGR